MDRALQKLREARAGRARLIAGPDLHRRDVVRRMCLEAVVQRIVEAVLQIEDEGVAVDLPHRLLNKHTPLTYGIIDGLHRGIARQHVLPHLRCCPQILAGPVNAALIAKITSRAVKGVDLLCQMICQQAGNETKPSALGRLVPIRQFGSFGLTPGFLVLPVFLV